MPESHIGVNGIRNIKKPQEFRREKGEPVAPTKRSSEIPITSYHDHTQH